MTYAEFQNFLFELSGDKKSELVWANIAIARHRSRKKL